MKNVFYLSFGLIISVFAFANEEIHYVNGEENSTDLLASLEIDQNANNLFDKFEKPEPDSIIIEQIQDDMQMRNFRVLLYGHGEAIIPGFGMGVRTYHSRFTMEYSAAIFLSGAKCSLSILKPFGQESRWYTGLGAGIFNEVFSDTYWSPYIPLIIGYEGKKSFWDLGIDFTTMFKFSPVPTLRWGFKF